jgi:uncharacterized protein
MQKISRYIVENHIFDKQDQKQKVLLFGTRKATFKVIDKGTWDAIKKKEFSKVNTDVIEKLKEDFILINEMEDEFDSIINENKQHINEADYLYLSVQPTAACPLGCGYCGQLHSPNKLSLENQSLLIERIREKLDMKNYVSLNVTWFGAEPMSGFSVITSLSEKIMHLVSEYKLKYFSKIVTNGLLLNQRNIDTMINQNKITEVEITLDGSKEYHDQRRHTKLNTETFDKIYQNILLLAQHEDVSIIIRCNVDERNRDGVSPLLKQMYYSGLSKRISFYVAPIHSWGNNAHEIAAEKNKFADWEIEWLMEMEELGFRTSYLPRRKKSVCFAVNPNHELIDPFGGIYGCSEVSLVPAYETNGKNIHEIGTLAEKSLSNPKARDLFGKFYDKEEISKYDCAKCEMLPTCGGGCPKEWVEGRIPCPSIKINIKERMFLLYLKHRDRFLAD